jgi:hypothetical protein
MKLIKSLDKINFKSVILLEFEDLKSVVIYLILVWWLSSWASFDFRLSEIITSFLYIILQICLIFPIIYIIGIWPSNILVNLGIVSSISQGYDFKWFWYYSLLYWILFIFLHYKLLRSHKIFYLLILAFLLLFTAHGCSDRVSYMFR